MNDKIDLYLLCRDKRYIQVIAYIDIDGYNPNPTYDDILNRVHDIRYVERCVYYIGDE